ASGPQPTPATSGPQPTPAASGPQPTPATAAPQPQLSPVPSAASPGTDVTRGQWQRLTAAVLLAEGRAAEAFAAYPGGPPEGMLVSQWLEEFLHLAEVAGHRDPAGVLARLETMSDELEMLLDSAGPDQTSPEPRERWQGLIRHLQALVAFAQGELETSISHWRAACEANPKDARLRQHLIRALTWRGNRDWRAGRTEEAVAAWAEARQRGGQDPELLRRLGLGYERLQLWQEANRCWEDYLRQLPEDDAGVAHNAGPSRGAVFLAMAANAARAGRRDEARKLLARAVRHASDRTRLLVWAGLLYISLRNGQKAVSALTRALELAPGDE